MIKKKKEIPPLGRIDLISVLFLIVGKALRKLGAFLTLKQLEITRKISIFNNN